MTCPARVSRNNGRCADADLADFVEFVDAAHPRECA